jgi:hypothetical protein
MPGNRQLMNTLNVELSDNQTKFLMMQSEIGAPRDTSQIITPNSKTFVASTQSVSQKYILINDLAEDDRGPKTYSISEPSYFCNIKLDILRAHFYASWYYLCSETYALLMLLL